jgi:hypothetical protein
MLFAIVKNTMDQHVMPNFASTTILSSSFDLWMFCNNMDIFTLVINFFGDTWVPMQVVMGLFEE